MLFNEIWRERRADNSLPDKDIDIHFTRYWPSGSRPSKTIIIKVIKTPHDIKKVSNIRNLKKINLKKKKKRKSARKNQTEFFHRDRLSIRNVKRLSGCRNPLFHVTQKFLIYY